MPCRLQFGHDNNNAQSGSGARIMKFGEVIASLPTRKAAVYTFERGKVIKHPYALLAQDIAQALAQLRKWGAEPGSRIGIFAHNSYHWLVYDMAMIALGAISVPFTEDFAGKLERDLLDRYQIALLLISKNNPLRGTQPYIATIDADNDEICAIPRPPDPDSDALTLAFSSGSAGGLKGLVISREGAEDTLLPILEEIGVTSDDRLLLFMPMSNFQQRTLYYTSLYRDCELVITDYLHLPAAIKQMQPTILIAPPMYFQMAYTRYVNFPAAKRKLWKFFSILLSAVPVAGLRRALAENLFAEFYQQFGGKMRVLITGMAPIKQEVVKFFDSMQLPLCESYGMVESGSLTWRPAHSKKYGSVGKPLRGVALEFTDEGEVIVRRDKTLTKHYFQSAEGENERTFIGPGRIATGDIGKLDGDGYLYLLGRKKELIITAGGYKLHPEVVERELAGCPEVAQAAVFLKRGASALTGVVALTQPQGDSAEARVREFVRGMKTTKAAQIGDVVFSDAPFSTENGMLRPNLKLDRRAIAARFNLN
jgi:long-subunit acyl-CoA synthetase (AMP-forming)